MLNIPLRANADYTSGYLVFPYDTAKLNNYDTGLPTGLHEWQLIDPSSSKGRKKYNPGAALTLLMSESLWLTQPRCIWPR